MDRSAAPLALQVGASEEGHVRAVTLELHHQSSPIHNGPPAANWPSTHNDYPRTKSEN